MHIDRTKPLNIHGPTPYKVADQPLQLGRTVEVHTLDIRCLLPHGRFPTGRANHGDLEHLTTRWLLLRDHTDAFRDHLSRLLNPKGGPQTDLQVVDKILVVQSTARHGSPTQTNRVKDGRWRNLPRSAHGELNLPQNRFLLLWRILIRHLVPCVFRGVPQLGPQHKVVYLDHSPVNVIGQRPPHVSDGFDGVPDLLPGLAHIVVGNHRDATVFQVVIGLRVGFQFFPLDVLNVEYKKG